MRIVDEWNHNDIKLTLFHMNGRYSIKFEKDILEQWYKFRDGQIKGAQHAKAILNEQFYKRVEDIFKIMNENREHILPKREEDLDFDTII